MCDAGPRDTSTPDPWAWPRLLAEVALSGCLTYAWGRTYIGAALQGGRPEGVFLAATVALLAAIMALTWGLGERPPFVRARRWLVPALGLAWLVAGLAFAHRLADLY